MNSAIELPPGQPWVNWVGSRSCNPRHFASATDEAEIAALVAAASARGLGVRVAATGHSFTPVVETDGLLLDLKGLSGVLAVDAARKRATARAGTQIRDFYHPLWDAGLALINQGDIDTQQIAGAVSTATHGSGTRYTHLGAVVRGARLVTASGEIREVTESEPDLLRAVQASVGMLGVMTQLELEVTDAYRLKQQVELWPWQEVLERWGELVEEHRHFGFFWLPSEESGALYNLDGHGHAMVDKCYVKIYDEAMPDEPDSEVEGRRVDRCYRIYPMVYDANFHELEYFVPLDRAPDALQALRELMLGSLPQSVYPMEVRTVGTDDAFLSPNYRTATTAISVSGKPGTDYWDYLRSVDALLNQFDARVHWGKLHFLTPERLHAMYPEADRFISIRRELDPAGTFLNPHLRELFD
ncbi:MAG TPA: D-arabinono-1,4-lactone oxidase [Solirubrobacteraceae bacterium]|nr:D-arabinono-1,4-lactone oxidase [Solirubrobacteraceae bacterium]